MDPELTPANPPNAKEGLPERYRALAREALQAEAHLKSIAAVQHAIVNGVKQGGTYGISHREGGSHIRHRSGQFVRTDHGDDPGGHLYAGEAEFLSKLRSFCSLESRRTAGDKPLPELDEWQPILRRMSPPTPKDRQHSSRGEFTRSGVRLSTCAVIPERVLPNS